MNNDPKDDVELDDDDTPCEHVWRTYGLPRTWRRRRGDDDDFDQPTYQKCIRCGEVMEH